MIPKSRYLLECGHSVIYRSGEITIRISGDDYRAIYENKEHRKLICPICLTLQEIKEEHKFRGGRP